MDTDAVDTPIFGGLAREEYEHVRRELIGYGYRMLGSFPNADDAVQETMIRAWRGAAGFGGRSTVRTRLHRIATNVCLDQLKDRGRRALPMDLGPAIAVHGADPGTPLPEHEWTLPAPDARVLADTADPAQLVVSRESVRLAFERYDVQRLTTLLRADAVQSMPPFPIWIQGPDEIAAWMPGPGAECRGSRLIPFRANGFPAYAQYRSDGKGGHLPWALTVMETSHGKISALHAFVFPELFPAYGFPAALEAEPAAD